MYWIKGHQFLDYCLNKKKKKTRLSQPAASNGTATKPSTANTSSFRSLLSPQNSNSSFHCDAELAAFLQQQEDRLAKEKDDMLSTPQGLAWNFVDSVVKETKTFDQNSGIRPVAVDDMVHQTEGMLRCKETFESANKETVVDLGFHFTKESAMGHIQCNGLMTKSDRESNPKLNSQESSHANGGFFGDGVYTGDYPSAFKRYGNIGILVARLKVSCCMWWHE